jgi:PAS domain-containing protein
MQSPKQQFGSPSTPSESIQELSEAELRALTNAMPAIVWACNAKGDIVYLNDRWYEYTGQTSAKFRDTDWICPVHPDEQARVYPIGDIVSRRARPMKANAAIVGMMVNTVGMNSALYPAGLLRDTLTSGTESASTSLSEKE